MEIHDNSAAVQDALQCIPPDLPRADWITICFALVSYCGKDQGGQMFNSWSQGGIKYDAADVRAVIKSADPNGKIKIATLFHIAKQYGYQPSSSGKSQDFATRNPILLVDKPKTDSEAQERLITAAKAQNIWEQADRQVSPSMPYVSRKQIIPTENLREITMSKVQSIIGYCPKSSGEPLTGDTVLVAPVWMFTEDGLAITNVELIDGDSRKAALAGRGTKKGGFWPVTSLPEGDGAGITILIGEGVATVFSAHHATGHFVVASLSAGNLAEIGKVLRSRYPEADIVMLADLGNGQADAEKAARLINCRIAFPVLPEGVEGKDFNDMAVHCDSEAVKAAIERAIDSTELWPDPQALAMNIAREEYPIQQLPKRIQDAVREVAAYVQAPLPLLASSALSAVSLAVQAQINAKRDSHLENPTSLFFLTIADSGERKSSGDHHFMKAIFEYDAEQEEIFRKEKANYDADVTIWESECAGIKDKIRADSKTNKDISKQKNDLYLLEKDKPQLPKVPKLIYMDATPEALARELSRRWPSGGLMSSEAGAVLGAHAMNSESIMRNLSQLNVMWDGGELSSLRKTSESFSVSHVRMTIGLMVQELVLRQFHAKSGGITRGSGFFARFLVSWPDSTQGSRYYVEAPSTWYARDAFNRRIADILRQQVPFDEKRRLTPIASVLSAEAKTAWEVFYNAIEKELGLGGELQDVRDIASKVADNAVRLAALFQYFEDGLTVISLESLTSAVNITAWHLNESRRFFGELALTEEQANLVRLDSWLIKYFKRNGTKSAKFADLQRYVTPTKFRKREELNNAFAQLIAADRISLEEVGGRTCIVRINPKLLKLEG